MMTLESENRTFLAISDVLSSDSRPTKDAEFQNGLQKETSLEVGDDNGPSLGYQAQ
jgi:hypothetical protein